jgi:hypothetical protein
MNAYHARDTQSSNDKYNIVTKALERINKESSIISVHVISNSLDEWRNQRSARQFTLHVCIPDWALAVTFIYKGKKF